MPHEQRDPPAGASIAERYCEECGQMTLWYLTLASPVPGVAGTSYVWICTGPSDGDHPD